MKTDLESARQILLQLEDQPANLESSLLRRVYWGLMIAEKELSCHTPADVHGKIAHIEAAEGWSDKIASQQLKYSERLSIELEQHIIRGRRAVLELRHRPGLEEIILLKNDAIAGIECKLEELEKVDLDRYHKHERLAREWRNRLMRDPS